MYPRFACNIYYLQAVAMVAGKASISMPGVVEMGSTAVYDLLYYACLSKGNGKCKQAPR